MGNEQPLVRLFSESRPTPCSLIVLENRPALATKEERDLHPDTFVAERGQICESVLS
jgi:hypothetical protein